MDATGNSLQVESAHATYTASADSTTSSSSRPPSLIVTFSTPRGPNNRVGVNLNSNLNQSFSTPSDVMSQQSSQAVDSQEVDDPMVDDVPSSSTQYASPARATTAAATSAAAPTTTTATATTTATTTTSGRGRGRGRWTRTKNKVAKPAQPKPPTGRGRRQKVYDSLKAQAAHERVQELKGAYSAIVKLVKPVVQEIADRSINELIEDPTAYEQVPEHQAAQDFLRARHYDTLQNCALRLHYGIGMTHHVYEAECTEVINSYNNQLAELCEDRYGQLLQQLDILEYLYDNDLPVDLPALPEDRYIEKKITEEEAKEQGIFYQKCDGVEVPFSGDTISQLMKKPQTAPLDPAKRKADAQPEGQPAPKAAATKEDDAMAQMPRHTAGLLGAAEAVEESGTTTPDSDSNAPTPTPVPEPAESAVPERIENKPATSGEATPDDGPELPLPRGASRADEYGVRLISRRPTRIDAPNNRIMVPNTFEWGDLDIGFRDSANCVKKGAIKQRRGKYLGKPGSNFMFIDRRVGIWDSTLAAGELDEELVKKHKLHPTLGIFLPDSVNEEEPPNLPVSGWKPVVLVPPTGDPIHASRSIPAARMDRETERVETRHEVARRLNKFCIQENIELEEVAPTPEIREEHRRKELLARGMDPAQVVQPEPSPQVSEPEPEPEPVEEDVTAFAQFTDDALNAAAAIEAEEEAARMAAAKRTQTSRPYDAIRDVFTDSPSARQPSPPPQAPPAKEPVDTTSLSCLADAALQPEPPAVNPTVAEPAQYNQAPNGAMISDYPVEYLQPAAEYQQPEPPRPIRQNDIPPPAEPVRANDFLRTALNPQPPAYAPPPTGPIQEYATASPALAPAPAPIQPQGMAGRTPFSNPGTAKGLPALRPMRNLLNETPPPEQQGGPAMHHSNMVVSNSGAFFPPAPSRPYHSGYSLQEPMQPMQTMMSQQPMGGPPLAPASQRQMSPYSVSPPPFHQTMVSSGLGPAPIASAPVHPQGPGAQQPLAPAAASSAANPKYRKLEPAPTPPHRIASSTNDKELRTVQFNYREAIKDYTPVEAPPRHGPTQIRGWTHNNHRRTRPTSTSRVSDAAAAAAAAANANVVNHPGHPDEASA